MKEILTDTVKVSLAVAVTLLIGMVAAGRWQGQVDTTISTLYEKATTNKEAIEKLHAHIDEVETRLNIHLENPKDCTCMKGPLP